MDKPKGIILFYSGTGNTWLACRYIADHLTNVEIELCDIINTDVPDLSKYDLVGFAAFADFLLPPFVFTQFINNLPQQDDKPAFAFNTYGMSNGRTLLGIEKAATSKGYRFVAGHALHMPENFPPMIARGLGNKNAPNKKEMTAFKTFVTELDDIALRLANGEPVTTVPIETNMPAKLVQYPSRMPERMMGEKCFDPSLCTTCGTCANVCPTGAITIDKGPIFDESKCSHCWACFNHCLFEAIYTEKYRGKARYSGPSAKLKEKFTK